MPDLSLPPCNDSTPIHFFAAFTTTDSDIPTGAAAPRGMRAIRMTTMNETSTFCLFIPIFSQSLPKERAFCGSSSMTFAKDFAFYQIKHIKKDGTKAWKS